MVVPRGKKGKGDSRRVVGCEEVEEVVFERVGKLGRRRRGKRVVEGSGGEWRSVDMVDDEEGNDGAEAVDGDSGEEEEEVGGVPIRLPEDTVPVRVPMAGDTAAGGGGEGEVGETAEQRIRRREGQVRAEEREMVRRAARRGCAFGFAVGEGERRVCEAVQKKRVVEASFAKGEWGVRWRE